MSDYLSPMMRALAYTGKNRLLEAWLMARASYAYTCSWIGKTDPSMGEPVFTRWDAIKGAVEIFIDYLRGRK